MSTSPIRALNLDPTKDKALVSWPDVRGFLPCLTVPGNLDGKGPETQTDLEGSLRWATK